MIIYPQTDYDEANFKNLIATALHSEWATAAIEAQIYGTENYITRCIIRDGIKEQRRLLGALRQKYAELTYEQQKGIEDPVRAAHVANQLAGATVANERMTAAIMHAMERGLPAQPAESEQKITVSAELPEIKISLPDRRTQTIIERDQWGAIIGAEQIESDAAV